MHYGKELISLVLGQPALIEEAQAVLNETDEKFLKILHDYIAGKISNSFKISEADDDINFWCPEWCQNIQNKPVASFCLECEGDDSDRSWLSVLCGQVRATGYFTFKPNYYGAFGIKKKDWKKYLLNYFSESSVFSDAGFTFDSNGEEIIIPIVLNASELAEKYPDLNECFGSIDSAIEAINALLPEFKKIVMAMKNWKDENK